MVLDLVWGNLINHANMHARIGQTGNASGPTAPLQVAAFRNNHISIIGRSIFVARYHVHKSAYDKLTEAAVNG